MPSRRDSFSNEVVPLPAEVTAIPVLSPERTAGAHLRRLGVKFGDAERPLRTPIVDDVFRVAAARATSSTVIWTNFDLVLKEDFYQVGFSVLRLDLIIERARHPSLALWTVRDLFNFKDTRPQGGHDCLVFPTHWIDCLDFRDFVFGVGGWGYAIFAELVHLSRLAGLPNGHAGPGFSVLKPGVHVDPGAITRHIGSQNANPKRFYSNPIPWLGPLRRRQLEYNMRLKFEVELALSIAGGNAAGSVCKRDYFSRQNTGCKLSPQFVCPLKKSGAQQPVAVACPSEALNPSLKDIIGSLTHMVLGTVHSINQSLSEMARHVALITHTTSMFVEPMVQSTTFQGWTSQQHTKRTGRWGPPAWDAVLLIIDPDPVRSILQWSGNEESIGLRKLDDRTRVNLDRWILRYKAFYTAWLSEAQHGGVPVYIVDLLGQGNRTVAAQELQVAAEVLMKAKLGQSSRWCRGAPRFNICCGLQAVEHLNAAKLPLQRNGGAKGSVAAWIWKKVEPVIEQLRRQWLLSRQRHRFSTTISACCAEAPWSSATSPMGGGMAPRLPSSQEGQNDVRLRNLVSDRSLSPMTSPAENETKRMRIHRAMPGLFSRIPPSSDINVSYASPCWQNRTIIHCVPHFFLLGQVKCGTTDFYASLTRHRDIRQTVKEQHFFSREWFKGDRYISQFSFPASAAPMFKNKLVGDGTPDYIWSHLRCLNREWKYPNNRTRVTIAEVIAEMNPRARLLLLLRDPVARLWSDFFYFAHRRERDVQLPAVSTLNASHFHNYVEYGIKKIKECTEKTGMDSCVWTARTMVFAAPTRLLMGCYAPYINEYFRNFAREQLAIFTLAQYHAKPREVLSRAFAHIGASTSLTETEWAAILRRSARAGGINQQGARYKSLSMLPETHAMLSQFYRPCNDALAALLNNSYFLDWGHKPQ